ncbi:LuxR C-terminal-related transcriptional regulator [Jiangella anatolica]|nr:LuxR C-terminal-related transcriptional regulator [Jiangella anatolica]
MTVAENDAVGVMHREVFDRDELALISLFAQGLCIETIARRLELSERTIRRRSRALCDRIGVTTTIQVVAWAARRRLI